MDYYPIFVSLRDERVIVSGAGEVAAAKVRLLLKTRAEICVYDDRPACSDILGWSSSGLLTYVPSRLTESDVLGARLLYAAHGDSGLDAIVYNLGKRAGVMVNIVDDLESSDFLTPAIVDRDPVTVAIGTEGTAPVLARKIKSDIESLLPTSVGILARLGSAFRPVVSQLKNAVSRRNFWTRYFFGEGERALASGGESGVRRRLRTLYDEATGTEISSGLVSFLGAGPGDPELLTLKARNRLHDADVILHDRLVDSRILELARRESTIVCVGKEGFGGGWSQDHINGLMVSESAQGKHVVRLKSGDPSIFGRLDEEIDFLDSANIAWEVIPGVTSASASAAAIGASLTRRHRNSSVEFLSAHDVNGFANHDWARLSKPGSVAAVYMGVRAATFLGGRLLMFGANPDTPVTVVQKVSRENQSIFETTIGDLASDSRRDQYTGPAIIFLGLSPRRATKKMSERLLDESVDEVVEEAI